MGKNGSSSLELKEMKEFSDQFIEERDWAQFHTPKNIAMGVAIEAAELMEIFQWLTDEQANAVENDPELKEKVADEMGDVLHYLIRLSSILDIDLKEAFWQKIRKTEKKYPSSLVKGKKDKYTAYTQ